MAFIHPKLSEFIAECGRRHTAFIAGSPGAGKTRALAQAVWLALDEGVALHEIAAYAPSRPLFQRLALAVAEELGAEESLFSPDLSGTPLEAMAAHTALEGELELTERIHAQVVEAWLGRVARTTPSADAAWLASLRPQALAALNVDYRARLERRPLPRIVHLAVLAEFAAAYKRREGLLDYADLLHGDYVVSPQVRLLVLDEVSEREQALVERFFPNASIIATGLTPRPAEIQIAVDG